MTFIVSHAEALSGYRPVYARAHRVPGLGLPDDCAVTANTGGLAERAREFIYRHLGIAGKFPTNLRRFSPSIAHAHFGMYGPAGRNGIVLLFFQGRPSRRDSVVLLFRRLVEKKGCEYFLRTVGQLRKQGASARTVILNDRPLRSFLERLSSARQAEVEYLAFRPLAEVRSWLMRASVVVVPSFTAANSDVLRSALLVDEHDVAGLAAGIVCFIENSDALEILGAAGRLFMQDCFSIAAQVEGLGRTHDRVRLEASRWS